MNYTDYRISLDIFKTASQATLPVKQGDTAYRLCITITANGSPYRITEGCYALFTAKKPDGNFINNECTIENNVIYYQLTPQTTAAIGVVECEVILYDSNDEQLATPHFTILVDKKAYNGEEIVSSSEVNMLEDLIEESKAQIARAEAVVSYSANALKGSAEGNPIRIDDVSPLEHEIAVRLTPNGTTVMVCGGNILPYPYTDTTKTASGITFTDNGDGTITGNGIATNTVEFKLCSSFAFKKGVTYTLSGCPDGGGMDSYLIHAQSGSAFDKGKGVTFTFDEDKNLYSAICIYAGTRLNNVVFKPMLNIGTTATEYEPYKEPTEYIADENGNVSVTSVYPTTTLMADNGAIISAEYNRDLNKAFAELMQAVAAAKEV